ncbi:MAG: dihydroxy-acid dehydratase [Bacteroidetes bacterium]|nr:MAG: dihydroxy-acid dehydratase [Bacteroidota bacterium]
MKLNRYSALYTENDELPAAQAMLIGAGLHREDFGKPQIGIGTSGYDGNTCNMHLRELGDRIRSSVQQNGLVGWRFDTIGVSDGITNGSPGMRYSLVSREIIADSIETIAGAHGYDGIVFVAGCDKNLPGALIAMARLNRPSLLVYGGSIRSGNFNGKKLDIVSCFEAFGKKMKGAMDEKEYRGVIDHACPGAGACGGMYTANTMASAAEALGMMLPGTAAFPALSEEKMQECDAAGAYLDNLLGKNICPRDILTPAAFRNAMVVVTVLGGSTNAVLHLLAVAHAAGVKLVLDDFEKISQATPLLADMKPSGKYLMEDLHHAGGTAVVMKTLLDKDLLDGTAMTVTGKTLAENLEHVRVFGNDEDLFRPLDRPLHATGHIRVLRGNLAPKGAVAKITGKEGESFSGEAIVFDSEVSMCESLRQGEIRKGHVIVIRYAGPKGGPGMPEMLKPTSAVIGAGLGPDVALITDGRFSGGSHGFVVGHISPEAFDGGAIALVHNGDRITIDAGMGEIVLHVDEKILRERKKSWAPRKCSVQSGVLFKYARTVSDASTGCITDSENQDENTL